MAKAKVKVKPNKKKSPNPPGRPNWTPTEETLKEVENMGALGMTSEQIADCLGIGTSTFYNKLNEYGEFLDAVKRGKAKGIRLVTSKLVENVQNANVTAQIFYLKCQAKWKEEKDLENNESFKEALEEIKAITKKCIKPL